MARWAVPGLFGCNAMGHDIVPFHQAGEGAKKVNVVCKCTANMFFYFYLSGKYIALVIAFSQNQNE